MSDDEWDTDIPAAAAAPKDNWDDEDQDDVQDSWDAEEPEAVVVVPASAPPKKKKTLAQKLAEKRADEAEKLRKAEEDAAESPMQLKERLAKSVMESDFQNAKDLIGDLSLEDAPVVVSSRLETDQPCSKSEFDEYIVLLSTRIASFESSPHYSYFCESLLRDMVVALSVDETRKLSASLSAMINEKQKAAKSGNKKKTSKKPSSTVSSSRGLDMTNYDDSYNEFEDFM